jgi:hypothetical protein
MFLIDTPSACAPPPAIFEPANRRGKVGARPSVKNAVESSTGFAARIAKFDDSPAIGNRQAGKKEEAAALAAAQVHQDIAARITELTSDATMANEPISQASLNDLLSFLSETRFSKRPAIFLLENGNFRAVWKAANKEQAAFQFRGKGVVHCVFFYKRASAQLPLNRETLIDVMPALREKYSSFEHLLNDSTS